MGIADRANSGFDNDLEFDAALSPLCTPLHIAVCSGQKSTARLLLGLGASVEACRDSHTTRSTNILHTAARCNDDTTIRYLVKQGLVDIDVANEIGGTALHCAALHQEDTSALTELINLGADRDARAGSTPFAYACHAGNFKAAFILLNSGLRQFGQEDGFLPLHNAVAPRSYYHPAGVPIVGDLEAWEQHREAFIRSIVSGDPMMGGFSIHDLDHKKRPILVLAASRSAPFRVIELLLDLGADINAQDKFGVTAIQEILRRGDASTTADIACLLRRGARLDLSSDTTGQWKRVHGFSGLDTALLATFGNINHPVLYTIFQHASKVNFAENSLTKIVQGLYRLGRHEDCQLMMLHGINGVPLEINQEWLRRWLQLSVDQRDLNQICLYLAQFPKYLTTKAALYMVLETYSRKHVARKFLDKEHLENDIIYTLLARPDLEIGKQMPGQSTLLHLACKHHHIHIIPRLVELGCEVNILDEKCCTPLFHAVSLACPHMVKSLLGLGGDPFRAPSKEERCDGGVLVPPGKRDPLNDQSAFQLAIARSPKEVNIHLLQAACLSAFVETSLVDIIIRERGLPPFPTDPGSITYIHEAVQNPGVLRVLLQRGADPNAGHIREQHPLSYACENVGLSQEVLESIVLLVSYGARTDERHRVSGKSFVDIVRHAHEAVATYQDLGRDNSYYPVFRAQCALIRYLRLVRDPILGRSVIEVRQPIKRWFGNT